MNDFTSYNDSTWYRQKTLVQARCALQNKNQDPVVQSIVSLTSSLSGQLVKCFTAL